MLDGRLRLISCSEVDGEETEEVEAKMHELLNLYVHDGDSSIAFLIALTIVELKGRLKGLGCGYKIDVLYPDGYCRVVGTDLENLIELFVACQGNPDLRLAAAVNLIGLLLEIRRRGGILMPRKWPDDLMEELPSAA